ncbi:DUF1772 domain-containing protein [Microbacterium lacticum]
MTAPRPRRGRQPPRIPAGYRPPWNCPIGQQVVGRGHAYGDRRLPVAGIVGVAGSAVAAVLAFLQHAWASGVAATLALVLLLAWLGIFARISAPINKRLSAAAYAGDVPRDARALQERWDSVIVLRAVIQGLALTLLCVSLALR